MPTPGSRIAAVVHQVVERASALARLEAELAVGELRRKAVSLGLGGALLAGGVILGLFALGFLLAAAAAGLASFLDTWLALLLVAVALTIFAVVLALTGLSRLKRGVPPIPEEAVSEAKLTARALKGDGGA
jgi:hypothetical protein